MRDYQKEFENRVEFIRQMVADSTRPVSYLATLAEKTAPWWEYSVKLPVRIR